MEQISFPWLHNTASDFFIFLPRDLLMVFESEKEREIIILL